jgi:YVTN family beta-propeller protein
MKNLIYILSVFITLAFYSCNENNPVIPPVISTSEGVFVLSEGGMTPGSSKLSYYNSKNDSFYVSVFNPTTLGLFPDGMIKYNNNLYITEQGNFYAAGKVYKTDMNGTVVSQNSVGTNPYSLCTANNKLYITNGPTSKVSVVEVNSLNTIKEINVGVYPQEIISYNNKVFVCNTSTYGGASDSTISVIDANSDEITKTLRVDKDPSGLVITNNGRLLVSSNSASGKIYVFEATNFNLIDSLYSPYGFSKDFSADKLSNVVYFIGSNSDIVKLNLDTRVFSKFITKPNAQSFIYGYAYDYVGQKHYLADAADFASSGSLLVYSASGTLSKTLITGVAPRRIIVNN